MNFSKVFISDLLVTAGVLQIILCIGSLVIPKLLSWKTELSKMNILIQQIFWTYAAYILFFNLSFGLLSVFVSEELINGSSLAKIITGFIAVYWIGRILIQFFYFDRKAAPKGFIYTVGEFGLVGLFIFLSIIYTVAFLVNFNFIVT